MPKVPDFLLPSPEDDVIKLPSRRELAAQIVLLIGSLILLALTEWLAPDVAVRFFTALVAAGMTCGAVFMALALRARRHVGANPPTSTLVLIGALYLFVFGIILGPLSYWLLRKAAGEDPFLADPDFPAYLVAAVVVVLAPPLDVLWRHWHLRQLRAASQRQASTASAAKLAELERIAFLDPLTGLPNRRHFERALQEACDGKDARHQSFAVMFFDFDKFKQINDTHGHAVGDRFLTTVAQRITAQLRSDDLAARLGGDEFAILVRGGDVRQASAAIGDRFARAMAEPFDLDGVRLKSSASIGIAIGESPGTRVQAVVHAADLAMYQAKVAGGARYAFADPAAAEMH